MSKAKQGPSSKGPKRPTGGKPGGELLGLYCKKTLEWRVGGRSLRLAVPVSVFSSFQVDRGTRALVAAMAARGRTWDWALDLGCGYGPIGLYLAAAGLARHVEAVDRDAVAVAFCRHNAEANGLGQQLAARGAIAYEGFEPRHYDVIATNLPAKAGEPVHRLMLLGAQPHIRPGGEVWAVVVAPLAPRIEEILAAGAVDVLAAVAKGGHVIYNYAFTGRPDVPDAPYLRGRVSFCWRKHAYALDALHGLKEFDTRSWATDLLLEAFRHLARRQAVGGLVVCNGQQGHLPILACRLAPGIRDVTLVSRDLIALQAARVNLLAAGYEGAVRGVHTPGFEPGWDAPRPYVALAVLNEKEGLEVNAAKLRSLLDACRGGCVIAGCKAGFGSRLGKALGARVSSQRKRKAFCAFVVR